MSLGSAPSTADYCSLGVLVVSVNAFYLTDRVKEKYERRLGSARYRSLPLTSVVISAALLAALPGERFVLWWLPFLQAGLPALIGTLGTPVLLLRRRPSWPPIRPEDRRVAALLIGLLLVAALTVVLGTTLLTIVTGDFRLAFAASLTAGFVIRWAWLLLIRRRPSAPASGT